MRSLEETADGGIYGEHIELEPWTLWATQSQIQCKLTDILVIHCRKTGMQPSLIDLVGYSLCRYIYSP